MNIGMLVSNEVVRDPRVLQEARSLVRRGHRVRIVGWDRFDPSVPDGPIGEGVEIALVRSVGTMRLAPGALFKNPLFWRRALRLALVWPADLWWAHDLDTLQAGVWLKRRTGKRLVFDAHELFPQMIWDDYPRRVALAAEKLEAKLLAEVDQVVTVNAALGEYYGEKRVPVAVVMNCREEVAERYVPPSAPVFTVLYVGTFHRQRFVFELIEAVQRTEGVRLLMGGHKSLSADVQRTCAASERTVFLGPVPQERVMPLTLESHLVAAMLDPTNVNNKMGTPNKLFEAMAAGRPVLATRGTLSGNIVEGLECGLAIAYSVDACVWAIEKLRDDANLQRAMGERSLRAAKEDYNWPAQEAKLAAVVERFAI
jgi:glycosyltransferase involved in cell wall biosynthesis